MEIDGEQNCSDSDDGSSASWVILDEDRQSDLVDALTPVNESAALGVQPSLEGAAAAPVQAQEDSPDGKMSGSDDSDRTVTHQTDVTRAPDSATASRVEEGSDVEVLPNDQLPSMSSVSDEYFEDDPVALPSDDSDEKHTPTSEPGSLPSATVLRHRHSAHSTDSETRPQQNRAQPEGEKDRWDDTDLSTIPDQTLPDSWASESSERHYVHRRNNAVNQLLSVLMVLCLTCVLGLGTGHFLGWLHHHEMTEEMVHSLDEKLDGLRDDLMTCMTTEDDQDLDNKWIKELLHENEALMHQLQGDQTPASQPAGCSESVAVLRDQLNQLRTENDELRASVAKLRYGSVSQDGHKLRWQQNQINELVTENGELGRELRRQRYLPNFNGDRLTPEVTGALEGGSDGATEALSVGEVTVTEWMENEATPQRPLEPTAEVAPANTPPQPVTLAGADTETSTAADAAEPLPAQIGSNVKDVKPDNSQGRGDQTSFVPNTANDTDPSLAAFYARRSSQRQWDRFRPAAADWQLRRGELRALRRGAFHHSSWLWERAQARQNLRQRRGDEAELPTNDQRWRQQRGHEKPGNRKRYEDHRRGDWSTYDDHDHEDEDDDDDEDDDGYVEKVAKTIRKAVKYQQKLWKAANRKAEKLYKKMRENHWKHFGGRHRHQDIHQRYYKY